MAGTISESYAALVNGLLRLLLCLSPWRAEEGYYSAMVAPPLQAKGWTKIQSPGRVSWIFIDEEAGTGRYRTNPPQGVDPAKIAVVDIPPHLVFGLRNMAKQLVEQSHADSLNPALKDIHPRLLAMGDGTFEMAENARFLQLCRSASINPGALREALQNYRTELLDGMCHTRYPGYYVGLMNLFFKAITGVEAIVLSGLLVPGGRVPNLIAMLKSAFDGILQNDGPSRIKKASLDLLADGKSHLEQAESAKRDEIFYGSLFKSCPFFNGAKMGFEFLAAISPIGSEERKTYEKKDYESEELQVYSTTSLLNHFDNLHCGWRQFKKHQRRVSNIRASKGDAAAELVVLEYIKLAHFYPSHYRDSLLNNLPAPPQATGTAGGAHIGNLCG